jgi:PKD repeat protein
MSTGNKKRSGFAIPERLWHISFVVGILLAMCLLVFPVNAWVNCTCGVDDAYNRSNVYSGYGGGSTCGFCKGATSNASSDALTCYGGTCWVHVYSPIDSTTARVVNRSNTNPIYWWVGGSGNNLTWGRGGGDRPPVPLKDSYPFWKTAVVNIRAGGYVNISTSGYSGWADLWTIQFDGVKPGPTADFNVTMNSSFVPLIATYIDTSTNYPTSYNWTLSNGTVLEGFSSVSEMITIPATYTISHCVSNEYGSSCIQKSFVATLGDPVCGFTALPMTGTVPHVITLQDTSTNNPTSYIWQVKKPDGTWWEKLTTGTAKENVTLDQMGYYSAYHVVENAAGNDSCMISNIYAGIAANVTLNTTTVKNVTTIATLAPIPTGIGEIINATSYRTNIENSAIGCLTAPYISTVDNIGTDIENFGLSIVAVLVLPFTYITPAVSDALDLATGFITYFASMGRWVLVSLGMVVAGLPIEIQGLITLGLIYQTLILAIKGRVGVK